MIGILVFAAAAIVPTGSADPEDACDLIVTCGSGEECGPIEEACCYEEMNLGCEGARHATSQCGTGLAKADAWGGTRRTRTVEATLLGRTYHSEGNSWGHTWDHKTGGSDRGTAYAESRGAPPTFC